MYINSTNIKIWILGFGKDVEVLEPAELRENMREIVCGLGLKHLRGDFLEQAAGK